jgi:hypothetical protein
MMERSRVSFPPRVVVFAGPRRGAVPALADDVLSPAPVTVASPPPWRRALVRALLLASVVGSALVLINHGDHLLMEPVCDRFFLKVSLSYLVPFAVSLVSTSLAVRDVRRPPTP